VLDLDAQVVVGIVEAAQAFPLDGQPAVPDDHQDHVAALEGLVDDLGEVLTRADRVEVDEDVVATEVVGQRVVEAPSLARRVLAAVTDEDLQGLVGIPLATLGR
jgi:hypothetical protein